MVKRGLLTFTAASISNFRNGFYSGGKKMSQNKITLIGLALFLWLNEIYVFDQPNWGVGIHVKISKRAKRVSLTLQCRLRTDYRKIQLHKRLGQTFLAKTNMHRAKSSTTFFTRHRKPPTARRRFRQNNKSKQIKILSAAVAERKSFG